ncbi:hypothetical protein AMJ86_04485 [bacterium SM23_57]|nr:MAG: hypothetical protein AMJ86_04485 [bacterium SM23_57]
MINEALAVFLSLYPWNLGVGGYYTVGEYSTARTYRSQKAMISMDRRSKDLFVLDYEHLSIEDDLSTYKQDNVLIRNLFWIKPEFRIGNIAGYIQSNSTEEGWLLGAQLEGDLPWFGYSMAYSYSEFQGWESMSTYWDITTYPITQWSVGISKKLGPVIVRTQAVTQNTWGVNYWKCSGKVIANLLKNIYVTLYGETGESRYALDPYLLVLDNNPDILHQSYGLYAVYQVHTNISLSCEALRKEYSPIFEYTGSTDYHVQYLVFGIQLRL